ncbi:MAG: ATP-binding protein, partial [Actinomycetales bacterium]
MTIPGLRTTHDWSADVEVAHVEAVRGDAAHLSAGGATHLVLEVVEYALDEAREGATTRVDVVRHGDGSIEVVDDGRGTDTRLDVHGIPMVKPVMAT